jgi:hypothetical protein
VAGDVLVCQSNACYSFLGRKLGLWGATEMDIIACEQLLCEAMDLRNAVVGFSYGRTALDPLDSQQAQAFITSQQVGILKKLDVWLSRQEKFSAQSPFFVSGYPTAPDFHLFELLDQMELIAHCISLPSVTSGVVTTTSHSSGNDTSSERIELSFLHIFYQNFRKLPENEKYFASKMATAPCNNLTAVFGSMSCGQRWEKGTALPEDTGGVY